MFRLDISENNNVVSLKCNDFYFTSLSGPLLPFPTESGTGFSVQG